MKAPEELQKAVESYKAGNGEAFEQVYNLSHKYLYVCIRHIVRDDEAAVDMLQETYLEISRNIGQLNSIEDFLNWAAVIAKRKCYAYMNKSDKYVIFGSGKDEEEQDIIESVADNEAFIPESIMQDREKSRLIMEIIDGLSDMQRLCVIAYFYNEQTQEEIAEELGIPVNTVKSHINRAKVKIKEEVLTLEREKDTKLYAIIPFMLLYFAKEAQDCEAVPMPDTLANLIVKPESDSSEKKGGKLAKLSTKAKLLIGTLVFIGAAAITGAVIMNATSGNEQPAEQELALAEAENTGTEEEELLEMETAEETELPAENEEEGYAELPISGVYDELREGRDGIIVARNGEKWGLVTYDNEILVPFEYDEACQAPNDDGQTFFGNEGDYRVFDREGNEIFTTDKPIKAVSEGVVLWQQLDEREIFINFGYVKLDGTVLYESDGEDVYRQSGAVGFNEGFAVFATYDIEEGESEYLMEADGKFVDIFDKRDRNIFPERYQPHEASGTMGGSGTGTNFITSYPIGACYKEYYVNRGMAFEDLYSMFWLHNVEGTEQYSFDMHDFADYAGYSWGDGVNWGVTAFYNNGNYCYSAETVIAIYMGSDEERKYYLIDTAKQEVVKDGYSHETILTDSAILAQGEYIEISDTTYWLAKQDGKWGYMDHDGNLIATFDDASRFYNGQAMVIEDGYAHFIDEDMNLGEWKIPADSVGGYGEVYVLETPEGQKCFVAPET
ncbi:MAG: sigma-70 family RNA polymerase sigma factor [Lachnospiraceae bacterium]|nr:sigma-70 family RNA polymerase sigma factor [Lachnospiraceae bacterium]